MATQEEVNKAITPLICGLFCIVLIFLTDNILTKFGLLLLQISLMLPMIKLWIKDYKEGN